MLSTCKINSVPKVMGIVNVTPDSFSDGGQFFKPETAIRRAKNLAADGADIIDLGAESTRPGATPISWQEEWARLEPVLSMLIGILKIPISIDTYHPETAAKALALGAKIINCVYSEPVPEMLKMLAQYPQTELVLPAKSLNLCPAALRERVYIDPMIGFGTTRQEDLELFQSIPELAKRGRVLIGISRKRIVRQLLLVGENAAADRQCANRVGKLLGANLALAILAAQRGASCLRVHDVAETVQALRILRATL